jgi:hypothetical protein
MLKMEIFCKNLRGILINFSHAASIMRETPLSLDPKTILVEFGETK